MQSTDSIRVERAGSVNHATSYSAGTEHTATVEHRVDNVDQHCRQAWTNSPPCDVSMFLPGKPPLPPLSHGSNLADMSQQHVLSKKEEDISEEWLVDVA